MNKNPKSKDPLVQILIILSVIISTVAIYFIMTNSGSDKKKYGASTQHSSTWKNLGGDFQLLDMNGQNFASTKLRGRASLIYFGFISCPDICPTELQKITEAIQIVEKQNIDVTPVFITIDPVRDTASIIKTYLSHFHNKFIGLTGAEQEIRKVADMFGVYYERAGDANDKNYMMNHTAYVYLSNKYGKFVRFFDTSSDANEIAEALIELNQ